MLVHAHGHGERADFLGDDLLRVAAEDEMHLMRRAVELIEQALEITPPPCAGRGEEFSF